MKKIIALSLILFLSASMVACSNNETVFNIGDTLSFPGRFEIILKSTEFAKTVKPTKASGYYSYYEVEDADKVFYHAIFDVKNLSGSGLSADEVFNVKLLYDGKYEYTGFSTIEEDGGSDFTYTNITKIDPLDTAKLHYLIEIPKEVKESGKSIALYIIVDHKKMKCSGISGTEKITSDEGKNSVDENTSWKNYEPLTLDNTIVEKDYAEMTVKKAEFTTTVKPSKASKYYSYYEVKDSNKVYAHIMIAFKNLKSTGANADEMARVELLFDNKYTYTGFSAIEEDGGSDLTYSSISTIDPLDTGIIHYLIEVPKEIQTSGKPVVFTIALNEGQYYFEFVK